MRALPAAIVTALLLAAPALAAQPQISYTLSGPPGDNGWYRGPVTASWTVSGAQDVDCKGRYSDDTPGARLSCTASNADGPSTTMETEVFRIDQHAPTDVTGRTARPPDLTGWYTAPLDLAWTGADALSGIASCTALTYSGPDSVTAAPAGSCRDRAGNVSAPVAVVLAYDVTAPALTGVTAAPAGAQATVRWVAAADAARITVVREPGDGEAASKTIADGPSATPEVVDRGLVAGATYRWTVTARDAAGNAATAAATAALPVRPAPAMPGTTAAAGGRGRAPLVRWRSLTRARYYNFQLLRGKRKILSTWPSRSRYQVRRTWRYGGRRHSLGKGTYAWYVWPGYGRRADRRYGRLLAHGRFTVR